jgi:hypothetical protein
MEPPSGLHQTRLRQELSYNKVPIRLVWLVCLAVSIQFCRRDVMYSINFYQSVLTVIRGISHARLSVNIEASPDFHPGQHRLFPRTLCTLVVTHEVFKKTSTVLVLMRVISFSYFCNGSSNKIHTLSCLI